MAKASTEKTNGSQFAGVSIPQDADFRGLREFAHSLAQQKYDEADGDRKVALNDLMKMGEVRPDILEALETVAFHEFWHDQLRLCSKHQRKRIQNVIRGNEQKEQWAPADDLGKGMAAKRKNMDTIYAYQFPFLVKAIGLATKAEFVIAVSKVADRFAYDKKLLGLGESISKRIAKADKDAQIQDIVSTEELARIFRQSGVVT